MYLFMSVGVHNFKSSILSLRTIFLSLTVSSSNLNDLGATLLTDYNTGRWVDWMGDMLCALVLSNRSDLTHCVSHIFVTFYFIFINMFISEQLLSPKEI